MIFHSYVKLPEGRPLDTSKFLVSTWLVAQDSVAKGLWAPKSADGEVKAVPRWFQQKSGMFAPNMWAVPSGKRLRNYGKPPFFMAKSTISMAIFNSYVFLNLGIWVCLKMLG